jgi:acyl-CoA thioester hydrolase
MPRIKIELPDRFSFTTEVAVYLSHINYGGHLDNAQLLTLVSEARSRYFKALGYHEGDVEGVGILLADAAVQYKSEAFQGEIMVVAMTAHDFNAKGCDLVWRMNDQATGREVARGKCGIVFFDYTRRKVTDMPAQFRQRATA